MVESLLSRSSRIQAVAGDNHLGGNDFDMLVAGNISAGCMDWIMNP